MIAKKGKNMKSKILTPDEAVKVSNQLNFRHRFDSKDAMLCIHTLTEKKYARLKRKAGKFITFIET